MSYKVSSSRFKTTRVVRGRHPFALPVGLLVAALQLPEVLHFLASFGITPGGAAACTSSTASACASNRSARVSAMRVGHCITLGVRGGVARGAKPSLCDHATYMVMAWSLLN